MGELVVHVNWDSPNYGPLNGFHPLFDFLLDDFFDKKEVTFLNFSIKEKCEKYYSFDEHFRSQLTKICNANKTNKPFNMVWNYFSIEDQFLNEVSAIGLRFEHTFPLSLGISDFVFHLESVESLFLPFVHATGLNWLDDKGGDVRKQYLAFLSGLLSSDKCKKIFTNYDTTAFNFKNLFPDVDANKIKVIDFKSLHPSTSVCRSTDRSSGTYKDRILFTHSFHGNVSSIKSRGIDEFLNFSMALSKNSALAHLKPTLLLPADYKSDFDFSCLNIDVFFGYVPPRKYKEILDQSGYLFLPSPAIHSKVIIDCVNHGITPIVRNHSPYSCLGLNNHNSIFLSQIETDPLSSECPFSTLDDRDLENLLKEIEKRELTTNCDPAAQPSSKSGEDVLEFNRLLSIFKEGDSRCANSQSNVPICFEVLKRAHFTSAPRFSLLATFNGFYIFTNRRHFVISKSSQPPASLNELLACETNLSRGIVMEDLMGLSLNNNLPSPGAFNFKERVRLSLQNAPLLYFSVRSIYRFCKKIRHLF